MSQNTLETFIERISQSEAVDETPENIKSCEDLMKEIEETVNLAQLIQKLYAAKQDKFVIKEIKLESEIDFIKSINQLKQVFQSELYSATNTIKSLYANELINLETIRQKEIFGKHLITLITELSSSGYCLVMKNSIVWAYKYYESPYEVVIGHKETQSDEVNEYIVEYEEPVCKIKSIYVNLLHPKITLGTIMLNTEGRHPNAEDSGLTSVCSGTLEDREIVLTEPEKLITLLDEICHTYEIMNLASAYYIPTGKYKKVEEAVESTWNSA